jgi:hypothetical protein
MRLRGAPWVRERFLYMPKSYGKAAFKLEGARTRTGCIKKPLGEKATGLRLEAISTARRKLSSRSVVTSVGWSWPGERKTLQLEARSSLSTNRTLPGPVEQSRWPA